VTVSSAQLAVDSDSARSAPTTRRLTSVRRSPTGAPTGAPNVVRVIGILLGRWKSWKGPPKIAPPSLLEQGRSDHEALDLARPLVNLGDLRVPEVPLGRK